MSPNFIKPKDAVAATIRFRQRMKKAQEEERQTMPEHTIIEDAVGAAGLVVLIFSLILFCIVSGC